MARRGMALALEGRVEGEAVHLAATSPGSAPTKHLHRKQNLRRKTVSNKVMTSGKGRRTSRSNLTSSGEPRRILKIFMNYPKVTKLIVLKKIRLVPLIRLGFPVRSVDCTIMSLRTAED